ncbi:NUDIX domain-containing protein [Candidatus Pacearchaeota archaeon]|nr:NUDIX domain-containing protein [Candidatus Pacearchaeota archaeon]
MKKGKYRKGMFIVTYAIVNGKPEYLILKRKLHWTGWEFPKGGVGGLFETKKQTAKRELEEETGLKILKIKNFKESGEYKYKKELPDRKGIIGQTYHLFSAEVKKGSVELDCLEHHGHKWVDFKHAIKMLTWPNQRKCMRIVNSDINSQNL